MILQVPPEAKTYEMRNSLIWSDEHGIIYSIPRPGEFHQQTREETVEEIKRFQEIAGNKKVCIIIESHPDATQPRKEDRDFISEQLAQVTKAMAIITPNAVSRMIANLFFSFKPAPYPVKLFNNEFAAREWILQYTDNNKGYSIKNNLDVLLW